METVERWFNGQWGKWGRRDVWLQSDGRRWQVEARVGVAGSPTTVVPCDDEQSAREQLALLLSEHGPWSQLSQGRR